MDKRELKKKLDYYMIAQMHRNMPNQFGERPHELFLHEIGIEAPSQAQRERLNRLIEELWMKAFRKMRK